jgi:hypothetical protein
VVVEPFEGFEFWNDLHPLTARSISRLVPTNERSVFGELKGVVESASRVTREETVFTDGHCFYLLSLFSSVVRQGRLNNGPDSTPRRNSPSGPSTRL